MKLSEDQKNQVRKDLAAYQKHVASVNREPDDLLIAGTRILETLAIACGVFEVESEA